MEDGSVFAALPAIKQWSGMGCIKLSSTYLWVSSSTNGFWFTSAGIALAPTVERYAPSTKTTYVGIPAKWRPKAAAIFRNWDGGRSPYYDGLPTIMRRWKVSQVSAAMAPLLKEPLRASCTKGLSQPVAQTRVFRGTGLCKNAYEPFHFAGESYSIIGPPYRCRISSLTEVLYNHMFSSSIGVQLRAGASPGTGAICDDELT